ncbi:unnamed protein product [Bursaphelenchus xylophilus]|uniref:(pine wood nematode) hypothetical protein n=1 Tax=Bursaphelenchus xylophilus TaxID=6326 RepID=A0A811JY00_BURXY|nr:unnamed protein product [Bursaphelenchus xylophilus]CAG9080150.1 unnamed protein product [Bursaphelenchus xylophilus]
MISRLICHISSVEHYSISLSTRKITAKNRKPPSSCSLPVLAEKTSAIAPTVAASSSSRPSSRVVAVEMLPAAAVVESNSTFQKRKRSFRSTSTNGA